MHAETSLLHVAVSSGSACTSADPAPSDVLQSLGLSSDQARASLGSGLGRFNTPEEVDYVIQAAAAATTRLRQLSPPTVPVRRPGAQTVGS